MKKTTFFTTLLFDKKQCRPRMSLSGTQFVDPRLKRAGMTMMLVAAFLLSLSSPSVFAQMPVPVTAPLGVPAGMEQIGVVAAARD